MTPRFFAAIAAAYQSLSHQLASHLPVMTDPAAAVPAQAAALRHALSAHLPAGWMLVRGYLSHAGQASPLLEGLLIEQSAQLPFHSPDLVVAPAAAVRGILHILPAEEEDTALLHLAEAAALWREAAQRPEGPVVAWLAQPGSDAGRWLTRCQQSAQQQTLRRIDLLTIAPDTQITFADQAWYLSQWRSKRGKSPEQPLALAHALACLMQPIDAQATANWQQVDGFSPRVQASLSLLDAPAPSEATPEAQPVAAHDTPPQQSASAQASAALPTPATVDHKARQALHTPDQAGYYPLHRAVLDQDLKQVQALLSQGAVTEVKDKDGNTPLHLAVLANQRPMAQVLLQQGADPNNRNYLAAAPLHLAVDHAMDELAALVIEHGAELEARNNRGKTPLHLAATNGSVPCARVLLQQQANLEATMEKDIRPLHLAAWYGQGEVAQFLIDQGADLDAINTDGNSPLHFAAFNGQVRLIKLLISNGASMQIANRAGETYLQGINEGYQGEMIAVLE